MAMPLGPERVAQVARTELVEVLITEMFAEERLETRTYAPSTVTAMPTGLEPTGMVSTTVFVAVLTTDTLFPISLDTYPYGCAETARAVAMNAKTRKQKTLITLCARIDFSP